jgi:hypothetical protein
MAWVYKANLNKGRHWLAGCGFQNATLSFGGWDGSSSLATTEAYNSYFFTKLNALRFIKMPAPNFFPFFK